MLRDRIDPILAYLLIVCFKEELSIIVFDTDEELFSNVMREIIMVLFHLRFAFDFLNGAGVQVKVQRALEFSIF